MQIPTFVSNYSRVTTHLLVYNPKFKACRILARACKQNKLKVTNYLVDRFLLMVLYTKASPDEQQPRALLLRESMVAMHLSRAHEDFCCIVQNYLLARI